MIEAEGLTKRYGPTGALAGIDLQVPAGSILGVLGPNGAGKTTAVRILTTLSRPDSGWARVAGHDVVREAAAVQRNIGVTAQDATVDEVLTGQGVGLVILFPLAIVSNGLVPTQRMPAVLRFIADWNPVSAVTAAARHLWGNPNPSATIHAWPMQHPVAASLLWSLALLVIFAPLATLLYRRRTTG